MPDEIVRYLLEIGLDSAKAKEAAKGIEDIRKGMQSAERQADQATQALRKTAEAGSRLIQDGATVSLSGGAILAPFIAAANTYVQRYGQLEVTSRKFLAAQQASSDATARLGRVAASQLTPVLNQVAAVQAKIAAFAEAHPEIAKAAIVGGAGLVAGGGALVMAGTAISSIAKAAELLKSSGAGGLLGGLAKVGITVGAIAVASELAVKGLNAVGQATGDQRLATIGLADVFKTGRELIATAIMEISKGLIGAKRGFEDLIDNVATGFRDLFSRLEEAFARFKNGLLEAIASILSTLGDKAGASAALASRDTRVMQLQGPTPSGGALSGNVFDQYRTQNASDLATRQAQREKDYQAGIAGLAPMASSLVQWAQTGQFQGPVGNVMNDLQKAFAGLTGGTAGGGSGAGGQGASPELVNAFIQRNKSLTESERQYGQAQIDAKKKWQLDDQKADEDYREGKAKADLDFMEASQKNTRDYQREEEKSQKEANKQRVRTLEDLNRDLTSLAAARDVAGFVERQRQGQLDLKRQQEDADDAAKERYQAFQDQQAETRKNYDNQLRDLETQHDKTIRENRQAYNEELDQLRTKHDQEQREIDRAFAEQLAAMTDNYAGLNQMQAAYYDQMNQDALNFVNTQKSYLQSLYAGVTGGSTAAANTTTTTEPTIRAATYNAYSGNTSTATYRAPVAHGSFAGGLPDGAVPYDNFPVLLHRGEGVRTSAQNAQYGSPVSVTVQVINPIGADQIEERATIGAVKGVRQAQELARARLGGN